MRNKLLIFGSVILMLISLGLIFAGTSNYKFYDNIKNEVTIKEGGMFGSDLVKLTLKSQHINMVEIGKIVKIAEIGISPSRNYTNALKNITFIDLKTGKQINRNFDYKYLVLNNISVNDYAQDCKIKKDENGTSRNVCSKIKIGSHIEVNEQWINMSKDMVKKSDDLIIGIFTEVKPRDYVEWIPTFYDVEINEWAIWSAIANLCKQESTNGTTAGDGSCGLNYSGNYIKTINAGSEAGHILSLAYDGDWGTNGYCTGAPGNCSIVSKYFKPVGALEGSVWEYKSDYIPETFNITIPSDCWSYSSTNLSLRISDYHDTNQNSYAWCRNVTGWKLLTDTGNTGLGLWEERIWWNVTNGQVILNSPPNNNFSKNPIVFNASFTTHSVNIANMSLYIGGLINITNQVSGNSNETNFTISLQDGSYLWNVLVCDADGDCAFSDLNRTINVDNTGTNITINSPLNNSFLNYSRNIYFNFTPFDQVGVSRVDLYGNWTGSWSLNYSWINPTNNSMNFTTLNISDGKYKFGYTSNDTLGNIAYSDNFTFIVDTVVPTMNNMTIQTFAGNQSFMFLSNITDANLNSCWYSVFNLAGGIDGASSNLSFQCNNNTVSAVSSYATFNLFLYANDSAGNKNQQNLSFIVSASSGGDITGGGGGGGSVTYILSNETTQITNVCKPFKDSFLNSWENSKAEDSYLGKVKILWSNWWNFILCKSASSIIPI